MELINLWKTELLSNEANYWIIKMKSDKTRIKFNIPEVDLKEEFVKGFGPGG